MIDALLAVDVGRVITRALRRQKIRDLNRLVLDEIRDGLRHAASSRSAAGGGR